MWETISHEAIDVNAHVQLQKASFSWKKYAVSKILPKIVTGLILLAPSVCADATVSDRSQTGAL